jgi:hypothetical protein
MKKQTTNLREIVNTEDLLKEIVAWTGKMVAKGVKTLYFNHDKLNYENRGLVAYNVESRDVVVMNIGMETNVLVAKDIYLNGSRVEPLLPLADIDLNNIFDNGLVYAYLTKDDKYVCSDSSKNKQLNFEDQLKDGLKIFYNSQYTNNEYPKYLVSEKENGYALCDHCKSLLLDELDYATINGSNFCFKCVQELHKEGSVDANHYKLMKLHDLEKSM